LRGIKLKKKFISLRLLLLSLVKSPIAFISFIKAIRNEEIYENRKHIEMASNWLLKAQEVGPDNGYSRGFYLYKGGWDKSYIETTGYIIQTLLAVFELTKNDKYKVSALDAGEWLLNIQSASGAFTDIDKDIELVFDTGQVLYGLIAIYELDSLDDNLKERYRKSIDHASRWLCDIQDSDGSWTKYGFNGIAHSYYSRVSSILYKAGIILENKRYKDCATKHINWVLSCQLENAFFDKLKFTPEEDSLLHTIIYVLEGLYDYYIYTKDDRVLKALLNNAKKLNKINSEVDLLLCSQYDTNFNCINKERCITGLAQWSALAFKIYKITNDKTYLRNAQKTLYYLKSKQFKENKDLKGALPGSVPFWGTYAPYSAINWGVKFYLDALLENELYKLSLIEDSNLWIGECFKFESHVVDSSFSETSKEYLKTLQYYVENADSVLDLGCGEGKYIRYFQNQFKNKNINGIDPYFFDDIIVKKGDVYNISFNKKFNLIYTIEVLQHVKYLDTALKEIHNKLADDGVFIICDRNPNSFIGYIKFIQEFKDKWMYPFDSPFLEKWYSLSEWKSILNKNNFEIQKIITFKNPLNWMSKYNIIIIRKKK